jgi:hypothetical protein
MSLDEFLDATMFASIVMVIAAAIFLSGLGHLIAAVFRVLASVVRFVFTPEKWWPQ